MSEDYSFWKRFWVSIAVGLGVGSQTGAGSGQKEEKTGHYGWNFLGLEWFFLFGPLFGFDILYKKFGLTFSPLGIVGSNFIGLGVGGGVHFGRRINLGVFLPIEWLALAIPTLAAGLLSAIVGVVFVIGLVALILHFVRRRG